jgi:hypothetical protein
MYHFILQILIMLSLGLMVYMAARKIPQITDTVPEQTSGQPTGFWHRVELVLGRLPLDKFDLLFSQFLEKNIRKIKLLLARLDNYLAHHLEQFKKIKQRAHRKQQKKFALFEEQSDTKIEEKEEVIVPDKPEAKPVKKEAVILEISEKTEEISDPDQSIENTK